MRSLTLLLVFVCTTARAQSAPPMSQATVVSVASPATIAIQEGLAKLRASDVENAVIDFQRAVASDLASPDGHYYLGVVQRRLDRLDRAVESFRTALARADAANDVLFGARARVALAMTYERMPHHVDDARAAWLEVQTFATAHMPPLSPDIARAHVTNLDAIRELDRTYESVRHTIAERTRAQGAHHPR